MKILQLFKSVTGMRFRTMKRTLAVYQNNPKEHETLNKMNELDFHDTLQIQIPDVHCFSLPRGNIVGL